MSNITPFRAYISYRSTSRSSSIVRTTSRDINTTLICETNNLLLHGSELDIYPNREDASKYNLHKLKLIMKHNIFCFNKLLNLVLCSNEIIFALFSHKNG